MHIPRAGSWTVLIYTSASHDLEPAVHDSLQEIRDAYQQSGFHAQVVAQLGERGQATRMVLSGGAGTEEPLGAADMTASGTLADFLRWGMRRYPSEHYAVVLGGHGAGFAGAVTDAERRRMMTLPQIEAALGALPESPDLVIFNTCLMGQAEVASQLSGVTPHLVASQGELHGLGLPLGRWLGRLDAIGDGQAAAVALARECEAEPERAPAVSALNLEHWPAVQEGLDRLGGQVLTHPESLPRLRAHLREQPVPWPHAGDRPLTDLLDVRKLCQSWQEDESLPDSLRQAAGEVLQRLPALVAHRTDPDWNGLSVLAPEQPVGAFAEQLYRDLRWSQATRWDEAVHALSERGENS